MSEKTNDELIREIINGSEEAFNVLYERFHRMVYYVALKTMHNEADAQDVVQDVFIQIRRSLHMVKNAQYLQLWITRITVNKCNMMYRKRREVLLDIDENDKDERMKLAVNDHEYLPQQHFHFTNDQEILLCLIDQLPPAQRLMIILMYYEQLSVEEIAAVCDIPIGTVKSRLKTARDTLKRKIELYEKQEKVRLDFHGESLPAILALVLAKEAVQTDPNQPIVRKCGFKERYSRRITAGISALLLVGGFGILALLHQDENDVTYQAEAASIMPKDAYFTIMMWANTPTLMESKQKDIHEYQKYYDILKEEHGVYWRLFLKSGIHTYFETDFN